jgi:hypothetical protein
MADYSIDDRFETVAITWSQPEAAVMLSMFDFYGIPAFAVGGRHVSAYGPLVTALQGIQIRVAAAAAGDALDLLAEVAKQPAAVRPYAFASPGLYRLAVVLALAAALLTPMVLALADPLDQNALVSVMLMSPLLLVFNGALPRTSSTFFLGNRARRSAET